MSDFEADDQPTGEMPVIEPDTVAVPMRPPRHTAALRSAVLVGVGLAVGVVVMLVLTTGGDNDDSVRATDAASTDGSTTAPSKDPDASSDTAVVALEGDPAKPPPPGGVGGGGGGVAGGAGGGGAKPGEQGGTDEATPATDLPATTTSTTEATTTTTPSGGSTFPTFVTIPPPAILNFSLPPVYGSTALTSGFVPDPFNVGITAGGPVNVNYLGGGCSGYATSAPSFSVNYTSGAFPTLRFYFIGGADTTMIINTPGGSYVCVDDSFGTLNPTIDFNAPSGGRYDVWIATYAAGGSVGGTLYVTENTGNHP